MYTFIHAHTQTYVYVCVVVAVVVVAAAAGLQNNYLEELWKERERERIQLYFTTPHLAPSHSCQHHTHTHTCKHARTHTYRCNKAAPFPLCRGLIGGQQVSCNSSSSCNRCSSCQLLMFLRTSGACSRLAGDSVEPWASFSQLKWIIWADSPCCQLPERGPVVGGGKKPSGNIYRETLTTHFQLFSTLR